jgi:hypothetical protein
MDEDWTPQGRDRRLDTRRRKPKDETRRLIKKAQSPCSDQGHATWLERGSEFFEPIWVGLIRLLRYFGIQTDEPAYRSVLRVREMQIVRRGNGCALWWHGSDGWWYVGLNPRNHLAGKILSLP